MGSFCLNSTSELPLCQPIVRLPATASIVYNDLMEEKPIILLAEDEEEIRTMYGDKLEREGFGVFKAQNGRELLEMAKAHKPDLILLDLKMPIMDGLEAFQKLKADPAMQGIPTVFLTAFSDPTTVSNEIELVEKLGHVDFIKKGISLTDFVAEVKKHLPQAN